MVIKMDLANNHIRQGYLRTENHGNEMDLFKIQHHDPLVYGKGELLLGAKRGSIAAEVSVSRL